MKASLSVLLVGLSLLLGVTLMAGPVEAASGSQLLCGWTGQQTCALSVELQDRATDKAVPIGLRTLANRHLNNWNPVTGLVRDKTRDASGEFDAVQATGRLAAATVQAVQLKIVSLAGAIQVASTISDTLLLDLPRFHGLWPHCTRTAYTVGAASI